jgi:hypothetical protein
MVDTFPTSDRGGPGMEWIVVGLAFDVAGVVYTSIALDRVIAQLRTYDGPDADAYRKWRRRSGQGVLLIGLGFVGQIVGVRVA